MCIYIVDKYQLIWDCHNEPIERNNFCYQNSVQTDHKGKQSHMQGGFCWQEWSKKLQHKNVVDIGHTVLEVSATSLVCILSWEIARCVYEVTMLQWYCLGSGQLVRSDGVRWSGYLILNEKVYFMYQFHWNLSLFTVSICKLVWSQQKQSHWISDCWKLFLAIIEFGLIQGSYWVWAQPMSDDVTMQRNSLIS